ncbi:ribosomal L7Ae/L30e/S12e/Gadd45 family protein [uncultured Ruminococcus sp.]|uniref:L7Ae/L30e/S12e/Gadd45 family ribosomal protein n=1 Tax=uncultured Ruminococcus sp. TaxID=165186 RepID=UPI0025D85DEF|nr:ribosomal L7Ae/L30e/S12e/Gadd45 family protein [uncultured Ruminococcus sp.]
MSSEKSRRTINLLGICLRAGKAVKGFDSAVEAAKNGLAHCILTASDTSEKTRKEVGFYCEKFGIKHLPADVSKSEIGRLCGKETGVIAVTDKGFSDGFEKIISEISH